MVAKEAISSPATFGALKGPPKPLTLGLAQTDDPDNPVQRAYDALTRQADDRDRMRINGLDCDIAALRSVPMATKLRMQRDREKPIEDAIEELRRQLPAGLGRLVRWRR